MEIYILVKIAGGVCESCDYEEYCSVYDNKKQVLKDLFILCKNDAVYFKKERIPVKYQIHMYQLNKCDYENFSQSIWEREESGSLPYQIVFTAEVRDIGNVIIRLDDYEKLFDKVISEIEDSEKSETFEKMIKYNKFYNESCKGNNSCSYLRRELFNQEYEKSCSELKQKTKCLLGKEIEDELGFNVEQSLTLLESVMRHYKEDLKKDAHKKVDKLIEVQLIELSKELTDIILSNIRQ